MLKKLLALLVGVAIVSFTQASQAGTKQMPSITSQARKIITNRLCKASASHQYTQEEIYRAAYQMIQANYHPIDMTSNLNGSDGVFSRFIERMEKITTEQGISNEAINIATDVFIKCR